MRTAKHKATITTHRIAVCTEENTILCFLPALRPDAGFIRVDGFAEECETVFRPRVRPFCAIARILSRIADFENARKIEKFECEKSNQKLLPHHVFHTSGFQALRMSSFRTIMHICPKNTAKPASHKASFISSARRFALRLWECSRTLQATYPLCKKSFSAILSPFLSRPRCC